MSANAYEEVVRDRIVDLLNRNASLAQSFFGATRGLMRMCDAYGWAPETVMFRVPHLDARGWLRFRFDRGRRGYAGYREAFNATDFGRFQAQRNQASARFLRRCLSWRRTLERAYEQSFAFAIHKGVPFEELEYGVFRFGLPGEAWVRVHASEQSRVVAESKGE